MIKHLTELYFKKAFILYFISNLYDAEINYNCCTRKGLEKTVSKLYLNFKKIKQIILNISQLVHIVATNNLTNKFLIADRTNGIFTAPFPSNMPKKYEMKGNFFFVNFFTLRTCFLGRKVTTLNFTTSKLLFLLI